MKRTSAVALLAWGLLGVVLGWLAEVAFVQNGFPILQLHPIYSVTVTLYGIALVVLAFTIYRAVRSDKPSTLNPLWAAFVVQLIQATILAASLLTGFAAGTWLWMILQYAIPSHIIWTQVFGAIATIILLILAIVAEKLCELPPEDSDPEGASGVGA